MDNLLDELREVRGAVKIKLLEGINLRLEIIIILMGVIILLLCFNIN